MKLEECLKWRGMRLGPRWLTTYINELSPKLDHSEYLPDIDLSHPPPPLGGIGYNPPPFGVIRPIQAVGLRPNVWPQTVIWGVWGVGILGQGILSICYVI